MKTIYKRRRNIYINEEKMFEYKKKIYKKKFLKKI